METNYDGAVLGQYKSARSPLLDDNPHKTIVLIKRLARKAGHKLIH